MNFSINKKTLLIITAIVSSIVLFSCDDTLTVQNVDDKPMPNKNVSFSQNIYPIFQVKCAFSGCHASPSPANGLDLSSYYGVKADPNVVFPGEPDLSRLVWAIEGRAGISPMPPVGYAKPITPEQLRGIKTWIDEGALDN